MENIQARVDDLSHDGLGVVKVNECVYFIDGVLPGEMIEFKPGKKRRGKFEGQVINVFEPSEERVKPECEYFGVCGGCSLQHLGAEAQLIYKENILFQNLKRLGKVEPQSRIPPLQDNPWHYRRKARLGVKHVPKKGGVLVGFREKKSSFITSLQYCKTLDRRIADLLPDLHILMSSLSINSRIPQLEVAAGDLGIAMVLRHLDDLTKSDYAKLETWSQSHCVDMYTQSKGPDSVKPVWPAEPQSLRYAHEHYNVELEFSPLDFIQVNASVNQKMVRQAYEFLAPEPSDHILDLFCGLGNFTLPLATSEAQLTGIEGDSRLIEKANANAKLNGIENAKFSLLDLHAGDIASILHSENYNKVLIDPPRSGAFEVIREIIPQLNPELLVYVSCNPATLARDAEVMVHSNGYQLTHAGVIDMFPHTAHTESMAVFQRR